MERESSTRDRGWAGEDMDFICVLISSGGSSVKPPRLSSIGKLCKRSVKQVNNTLLTYSEDGSSISRLLTPPSVLSQSPLVFHFQGELYSRTTDPSDKQSKPMRTRRKPRGALQRSS